MKVATVKTLAANTLLAMAVSLALLLAAVAANSLAPGQSILTAGVARAQLIEPQNPEPESRRRPGMSEGLNNDMAEVTEYLQPPEDEETGEAPDPQPRPALELLDEIVANIEDYNNYERSQIYRLKAFAHYMLEDYPQAIENFELVVEQSPEIPLQMELTTLNQLASLYGSQEDFETALATMRRWAELSKSIGSDDYYFMAQLFYQLDDTDNALLHVNEAIRQYEEDDETPKENWWVMQRVLHFENENYDGAAEALEKLVRHYPKYEYWRQLSTMYGLMERPDDQLHAMEATYLMGGLEAERDLMNLARYFMGEEVPYKAAKIVSQGIENEAIEPNQDNLEFLGNAWRQAEEVDKALEALEQAADASDDGEIYARLASLYLLNDMHEQAAEAGRAAVASGDLSRVDQTYLVIGMAETNNHNFDAAIEAFEKAKEDERSEDAAESRIKYAENERKRRETLREEGLI